MKSSKASEKRAVTTITVKVERGNALRIPGDVLVLKYAQARYGVDRAAAKLFDVDGRMLPTPNDGEFQFVESAHGISASRTLVIGTPSLSEFWYQDVEKMSVLSLSSLAHVRAPIRNLVMTAHGEGVGLDPVGIIDASLNGLQSAVKAGRFPHSLQNIFIVSRNAENLDVFRRRLKQRLPDGLIGRGVSVVRADTKRDPDVFVVKPFVLPGQKDPVYEAILKGVREIKWPDGRSFDAKIVNPLPGQNIFNEILRQIRKAKYVVADFTPESVNVTSNPNVCFEAGYAYKAKGFRRMVPIARMGAKVPTDLDGKFFLFYRTPRHLSNELHRVLLELAQLNGDI